MKAHKEVVPGKERLTLVVSQDEAAILADALRAIMVAASSNGLGARTVLFRRLFLMVQYQRRQWFEASKLIRTGSRAKTERKKK